MLKRLRIVNFQCVKDWEEELSPGVNVFVGKSGRGKSARAVRPLKWLRFNRPLGESYRRWGSKETLVEVELTDGTRVARVKNDKDNRYELGEEKFRAFGQAPPEAIVKALNLGEINFQFQHDPLFLLSMTPAELSKVLNEIVGLDDIDRARGRINSILHRERQQVAVQESAKEELKARLDRYADLDQFEVDLRVLETLEEKLKSTRSSRDGLERIRTKLAIVQEGVERYKGLADAMNEVEEVGVLAQAADDTYRKVEDLMRLADRLRAWTEELAEYKTLPKLQAEFTRLERDAQEAGNKAQYLTLQAKALMGHSAAWQLADKDLRTRQSELYQLEGEWDEQCGDTCPLCGKEW